MQSKIVF